MLPQPSLLRMIANDTAAILREELQLLTRRDLFAAAALLSLQHVRLPELRAREAREMADALIKELDQ